MTRVGWVGLGAMGLPMARNVARAGHEVTAYDIDPARAASLGPDGVKPAGSIAEAAAGADVLVLMVATPAQVDSVLYGDDPAASALAPGAVHVSCSTISVELSAQLAQAHADAGQLFVAAPVFGRPEAAAAAKLFVVAGGAPTTIE